MKYARYNLLTSAGEGTAIVLIEIISIKTPPGVSVLITTPVRDSQKYSRHIHSVELRKRTDNLGSNVEL